MKDSEDCYKFICSFMQTKASVVLDYDKRYLIDTRLKPIIKKHELTDLEALVALLKKSPHSSISEDVLDALTTHETYFFRDQAPFAALTNTIIPTLIENNRATKSLKIWSAACSTGQEVYSLIMLLQSNFPELNDWNIYILGTDVCEHVLDKARNATYTDLEVERGMNEKQRKQYFTKTNDKWIFNKYKSYKAEFKKINLANRFPVLPLFDLILVRNVMIYFDTEVKRDVLNKVNQQLVDDGYLLLGSAETTINLSDCFERHSDSSATYYTKNKS